AVVGVAAERRGDRGGGRVEALPPGATGRPAVLLLLEELIGAVVPDLHRPGAVLARRDLALERRIVERVVLDVYRERLLAGLERYALRDRPARERAVPLEPEVVVQPASIVPLDDEDRLLRPATLRVDRLRRLLRIPLAAVLGERLRGHLESFADPRRSGCLNSRPIGKTPVQRRILVLRKASPPSGGVDSSGRISGPKSCRGRGKRLWMLWRG